MDILIQDVIRHCSSKDQIGAMVAAKALCTSLEINYFKTESIDDDTLDKLFYSLAVYGMTDEFPEKEDRVYDANDFCGEAEKASLCMKCCTLLLTEFPFINVKQHLMESLSSVVILGILHIENNPWSCTVSTRSASSLFSEIFRLCGVDNFTALFVTVMPASSRTIFGVILEKLKYRLQKNIWKRNPGMVFVYQYCLQRVRHPFLENYLQVILPVALNLTDDYMIPNKIIGVQCLHHIISNVIPTLLQRNGYSEVIYDALHQQLYHHDPVLVPLLHHSIIDILALVEPLPWKPENVVKTSRYHSVFALILNNLQIENQILLRQAFSENVSLFIEALGPSVIKHMKRLIPVMTSYLEISNDPEEITRLNILEAMKATILVAWPRIENHLEEIFTSLLKLMLDVTDRYSTTHDVSTLKIINKSQECLVLVKRLCPCVATRTLCTLQKEALPNDVKNCIETVLAT